MKSKIQNTGDLIETISFFLDQETEKPLDEMDTDLITACTELLLDLQNKNVTLSTKEIEERVKKIPFVEKNESKDVKTKPKTTAKKLLLIAAIVSILFTILSFSTTSSEWNMFDPLIEKYGRVSNAPEDVEFYENGTSYCVDGPAIVYDSFEEWAKNEDTDILLPKKFPDSFSFNGIMVAMEDGCKETIFSFRDGTTSYVVRKNTPIPQEVIDNVTPTTIGSTALYIEDLENVNHYQVYFSYKGDCYYIGHNNKQQVHEILKNLKIYF